MLGSMSDDHEQLDPAEALMREVGAQLRHVRLERGEELDEVAEHLRIKSAYLFGIEQGDLSRMPGRTYALGFLRSYADYLGFDGDDLIVQIKSTVANLTDRTRLRIRTPLPESRLPKAPILVLSLAALGAIYAGWSYLGDDNQPAIQIVAEVPGDLRSMAIDALEDESTRDVAPAPAVNAAGPPPAVAAEPAGSPALPPAAPVAAQRSPPGPEVSPPTVTPAIAPADRPNGALAIDERGLSLVRPEAGSEAGPAAPADQPEAAAPPTVAEDLGRSIERAPPAAAAAPADDGMSAGQTLAALAPAAGEPAAGLFDGAGQIYEADNTDARVVLRGRGSSWVRISSLSGDYLRTRTLQEGDFDDLELRGVKVEKAEKNVIPDKK
jgi:hypothetical protein